jgi:hypothetical protein
MLQFSPPTRQLLAHSARNAPNDGKQYPIQAQLHHVYARVLQDKQGVQVVNIQHVGLLVAPARLSRRCCGSQWQVIGVQAT